MVGRPRAAVWEFVALVAIFGASGIVWWTFAPTWWPDTDPTVLLVGEMAFKLVLVVGGYSLVRRWRRRGRKAPIESEA